MSSFKVQKMFGIDEIDIDGYVALAVIDAAYNDSEDFAFSINKIVKNPQIVVINDTDFDIGDDRQSACTNTLHFFGDAVDFPSTERYSLDVDETEFRDLGRHIKGITHSGKKILQVNCLPLSIVVKAAEVELESEGIDIADIRNNAEEEFDASRSPRGVSDMFAKTFTKRKEPSHLAKWRAACLSTRPKRETRIIPSKAKDPNWYAAAKRKYSMM